MNSRVILCPRVSENCSRRWSALKRPSQLKRIVKGLKQAQLEAVPPRRGWSLSATGSQRSPAKMQSTVHYARSMGARTTPIIQVTARNITRMVLRKRALPGKTCSATRAMKKHSVNRNVTMRSCQQRSPNLRNLTRNSSVQIKSAGVTATATPTHPEVMGLVALGI